ncbi:putative signal transducing protein [Photobacterium sp. Hal280]|uniref:putative signal transducing protein n=1 Tax=Photobacterium sp. Hal280 TaxID=3035163 RepID=UPI00301C47A0
MIVIARFSFPHEAHIAKASLEAAGIVSHLADEHTVNVQWLYSNAMGGVRLMVAKQDAEQARSILSCDFSQAVEDSHLFSGKADVCPHCASHDLMPYTQGKRPAFVVFLLLGFPLFFYRHGYRCKACGEFTEKL